jgi:sugar lactone lactonase YvrE
MAPLALLATAILCVGAGQRAKAQAPEAVLALTGYVSSVNSAPGLTKNPDYAAQAGRISANSRGDVFFQSKNYSNVDYVIEIPVNGGAQITLLSNLGGYTNPGVYADAENNLWVPNQSGGTLIYVPFVNGTYASNISANNLKACAKPLSSNTSSCNFYWNLAPVGNYIQPSDVGSDGNGNLYVMEKQDGITNGGFNRVIKVAEADGTVTVVVDNLNETGTAQVAADKAGDVIYTDGTGVFFFPAPTLPATTGTTNAVSIGTNLNDPTGISIDASGNLLIADTGNARIVEIPYSDGQLSVQNQFTLITGPEIQSGSQTAYYGPGEDGYGNIYFVGENQNSINHLQVGYLSLGPTTIGKGTQALTISVYFTASATYGSASLSGGSGTTVPYAPGAAPASVCVTGERYAAGDYCNLSVVYTANAAGLQPGVLRVLDSSKHLLGQAALSGSGQAPGLNVDPGTIATIGSGWTSPAAIAVDASGNTYVADATTGKIYRTPAGGGTTVAVANGLSAPTAVVLDGAGDLYVGESGSGQIVELPLANGSYGTPVVLATGLKGKSGLTIDPLGNLYVADSGNARVLLLSSSGNQSIGSLVTTVGSGFTMPVALAIDNASNLYVSDAGTGDVIQIALQTSQQLPILDGLKAAAGVAVDASGSLYAADSGAGTIVRIPNISGTLNKNFETTLATAVAKPDAIALDSNGNLYATDSTDATVAEMVRTAGILNFGFVNVLASSSAVSADVTDGGTTDLVLGTPDYIQSGATSSFKIQSTTTCASGATLAPGAACSVAAIFNPQTSGLLTDTLTFASNAANGAAASLALSGTGTQLTKSTLDIAITSPAGIPAYGQPVTVSAKLIPEPGGIGTPTGTVTFYVDTVPQTPVPLSNNAASIILISLTGGKHVLSASYSGNVDYASSASANLDIVIGTATTVTSDVVLTSASLWSNPVAVNPGNAVTMSVTISLPVPGTPTGTVTFFNGATALGSATVLAAKVNGAPGGQASFSTSTLAESTYNITATYNGDTNFTGSTSPDAVPLLVSTPTIKMTSNTLAISGGGGPATLTISSIAGFGASGCGTTNTCDVSLACSGLPTYAVCSFQPAYAVPSPVGTGTGPSSIGFSVLVNQPPPIPPTPAGFGTNPLERGQGGFARLLAICLTLLALLFGVAMTRARRSDWYRTWRWPIALLVLFSVCVIGTGACGGTGIGSFKTPAGTSTITVTATISSTASTPNPPPAQTLQFTLTVN